MENQNLNTMLNESLKNINILVDSTKVIGTPLHLDDNRMIIPLSKVDFGFALGGSEFVSKDEKIISNNLIRDDNFPFGGGSLGGANISPVGFLVIENNDVRLNKMEKDDTLLDKTISLLIEFVKKMSNKDN